MKKILLVLFVALAVLGMTGPATAQEEGNEVGTGSIDVKENIKIDGYNVIISDIAQEALNSGDAIAGDAMASATLGGASMDIDSPYDAVGYWDECWYDDSYYPYHCYWNGWYVGNDDNGAMVDWNTQEVGAASVAGVVVGNYVESSQNNNQQLLTQDVIVELVASTGTWPPETTTGDISVEQDISLYGINDIQSKLNQTAENSGSAEAGDASASAWMGGADFAINGSDNDYDLADVYGNSQSSFAFSGAFVGDGNIALIEQNMNEQELFQEVYKEDLLITGDPFVGIVVDVEIFKDIDINITKELDLGVTIDKTVTKTEG